MDRIHIETHAEHWLQQYVASIAELSRSDRIDALKELRYQLKFEVQKLHDANT